MISGCLLLYDCIQDIWKDGQRYGGMEGGIDGWMDKEMGGTGIDSSASVGYKILVPLCLETSKNVALQPFAS